MELKSADKRLTLMSMRIQPGQARELRTFTAEVHRSSHLKIGRAFIMRLAIQDLLARRDRLARVLERKAAEGDAFRQ